MNRIQMFSQWSSWSYSQHKQDCFWFYLGRKRTSSQGGRSSQRVWLVPLRSRKEEEDLTQEVINWAKSERMRGISQLSVYLSFPNPQRTWVSYEYVSLSFIFLTSVPGMVLVTQHTFNKCLVNKWTQQLYKKYC